MQERFSAAAPRNLQSEAVVNAGIWRSNVRIPGRGGSAGFFIVPDAERVWYNFRTTGVSLNPDDESRVEGIAWFRTTQWTMVMLAAKGQTPAGQAALAELYEIYWFPLYAFARRRGRSPHDAQDLTQDFFFEFDGTGDAEPG